MTEFYLWLGADKYFSNDVTKQNKAIISPLNCREVNYVKVLTFIQELSCILSTISIINYHHRFTSLIPGGDLRENTAL